MTCTLTSEKPPFSRCPAPVCVACPTWSGADRDGLAVARNGGDGPLSSRTDRQWTWLRMACQLLHIQTEFRQDDRLVRCRKGCACSTLSSLPFARKVAPLVTQRLRSHGRFARKVAPVFNSMHNGMRRSAETRFLRYIHEVD